LCRAPEVVMVSPPRVPRNAQSGRKESGGPPRTKGVKIQAWKGGGSGPTMKLSPGVAQRDLGTSTVSLTGLSPLMRPSRPVSTPEPAKQRPRLRDAAHLSARPIARRSGQEPYQRIGDRPASHRHDRRRQIQTHPPNGTSFTRQDKGRAAEDWQCSAASYQPR
jgi:hypothetical protein